MTEDTSVKLPKINNTFDENNIKSPYNKNNIYAKSTYNSNKSLDETQNENDQYSYSPAKRRNLSLDFKNLKQIQTFKKMAELNSQLLNNRINLLQNEQEKTWKKIEKTRKRAKEILAIKKERELRLQRELAVIEENEYKLRENKVRVIQVKQERQIARLRTLDNIYTNKKKEARERYEERHINDQRKNRMLNNMREEKYINSRKVKESEKVALLRLEELKRQRVLEGKEFREKKLLEEDQARLREERKVKALEMKELDLINSLQKTQQIQQTALQELENSLAKPTFSYKRYIKRNLVGISLDPDTLKNYQQNKRKGKKMSSLNASYSNSNDITNKRKSPALEMSQIQDAYVSNENTKKKSRS